MDIKQAVRMHGSGTFVLEKANGEFEVHVKDNILVDVGFDLICDCVGKASGRPNVISHIAVGTGTAAAAAVQTSLVNELSRLAATYAHAPGTKVFTMTATFLENVATGAITEAGVLNAASGGILLDRVVFPVINKGADDKLTATFTFTLS